MNKKPTLINHDPETGEVLPPDAVLLDAAAADAAPPSAALPDAVPPDAASAEDVAVSAASGVQSAPDAGAVAMSAALGAFQTPALAMQERVVRMVTVPVIPMRDDLCPITIVGSIVRPIFAARPVEEGADDATQAAAIRLPPAKIARLRSWNGMEANIVAGRVLVKELAQFYPDDSYVGRWFRITKLRKAPGKRYATYVIAEIEGPREGGAPADVVGEAEPPIAA